MNLERMSLADLEALEPLLAAIKAVGDPIPAPGRVGTIQMMPQLLAAILAYHRALLKIWQRTAGDLVDLAGDPSVNTFGGYQIGDQRGDVIIASAISDYLREARDRYAHAFQIGQRLAIRSTNRSRLSESQVEQRLRARLQNNEHYVVNSLFADLRSRYQEILRDPDLPAPDAAQAMKDYGDGQEFRAGDQYSRALWGVGHGGFAAEMEAAQSLINWVLTSGNPCDDCPTLQDNSPYGPLNPLPTVPGQGDTQCRTNCLCLLVEIGSEAAVSGPPAPPAPPTTAPHPLEPFPTAPRPHAQTEAISPSTAPADPLDKAVYNLERRIKDRGTEAGAFFGPDGEELWRGVGEVNKIDFPQDPAFYAKLREAGPVVFTHNHPKGSSLSINDVASAFNFNLSVVAAWSPEFRVAMAEMRAVGADYRYRIFPTEAVPFEPEGFALIQNAYVDADSEVGNELRPLVIAGTLKPEEAQILHFHKVWTLVSQRTGLGYARERWWDSTRRSP